MSFLPEWKRGERIKGADLTALRDALVRLCVAGKGILIRRMGNQVIFESTATGGGGGGMSGGFVALSIAVDGTISPDASTVNELSLGRVTESLYSASDLGKVYSVAPDKTHWTALSFLE